MIASRRHLDARADCPIRTSLQSVVGSPVSAGEFDRLRRRAWIERGVAVVPVAELPVGDKLRERLVERMTIQFGRRMRR